MATTNRGALAMADEEPGEAAENESAGYDAREAADPGLEEREPGEQQEPSEPQGPADSGAKPVDPKMLELVQLVAARAQQALAKSASELDSALKADPVQAAVEFGANALRGVVQAAEQAGKTLPFEVVINAGVALIQVIATIASEKGYLPDDQIETFLKEVFQQSVSAYAKMDVDDGLIGEQDQQAVQSAMSKGA